MRARIAGGILATLLISTGLVLAAPAPAGRLAPKDVEATFFTGQPFTASTLNNTKFKMVFQPGGTMTREPVSKKGAKAEGTWKLSQDGFCSTWKGSKESCYRVQANGTNKWSIVAASTTVAYWSK